MEFDLGHMFYDDYFLLNLDYLATKKFTNRANWNPKYIPHLKVSIVYSHSIPNSNQHQQNLY